VPRETLRKVNACLEGFAWCPGPNAEEDDGEETEETTTTEEQAVEAEPKAESEPSVQVEEEDEDEEDKKELGTTVRLRNLASGQESDLRYVTEGGFTDFEDAVEYDPDDPDLAEFEPEQRARMAALLPGSHYAMQFSERSLILLMGDNLFVHGGVLPVHVEYGIDRINAETQEWLRGETERPEIIKGKDSPQWVRLYSDEPGAEACTTVQEVLDALGAKRIVVGHTIAEGGIASHCDGRIWCIDVGMSAHYGGPVEVLEIKGDDVRVLRP